jgi:hypothetical protein
MLLVPPAPALLAVAVLETKQQLITLAVVVHLHLQPATNTLLGHFLSLLCLQQPSW